MIEIIRAHICSDALVVEKGNILYDSNWSTYSITNNIELLSEYYVNRECEKDERTNIHGYKTRRL